MINFLSANWIWILFAGLMITMHLGHGHGGHGGGHGGCGSHGAHHDQHDQHDQHDTTAATALPPHQDHVRLQKASALQPDSKVKQ